MAERQGTLLWARLDNRYGLAWGFFARGWLRSFSGVELPDELAHYAGPHVGVAVGEMEAADEATDALVGVGDGAAVEEAAGAEGFGEDGGEAFDFAGGGGRGFLQRASEFGRGFCVAQQFVEADGDGLAQVHRAMLGAGGDAQEPVAVAQVFVGQAGFFRAEEERDERCFSASSALACEALQNDARARLECAQLMMQLAAAGGCGADYERAVGDGFRYRAELFRAGEHRRGSYCRTRFAIRGVVGIYQAQMRAAEIAHGAGGGADIQRIARRDQHDAEIVHEGRGIHERLF